MNGVVKINPSEVPNDVYERTCRVLSRAVKEFYSNPNNRIAYEEWLKTPEGQRAQLSKEEREKFDTEHVKGAKNEQSTQKTDI